MTSPENPSPQQPNTPKAEQSSSSSAKSSWIQGLAQRSTGLPANETPIQAKDRMADKPLWRLAGIGVEFALTVGLFAWMGSAADNRWHTGPWIMVTLITIAVIGNLYLLIKEALRADSPTPRKK